MRFSILILAALAMAPAVRSAETESAAACVRAKAAFAFAACAETDARVRARVAFATVEECGHCVPEDVGRAAAIRTGRTMVLFVGGCSGVGAELLESGLILAKADRYDHDGRPATAKRAVILDPPAGGRNWTVQATVENLNPVNILHALPKPDAITVAPVPQPMPATIRLLPSCSNGNCQK
jgi:hypothetical protein